MGIEPKQRKIPYLLDDGEQSHDRQQVGKLWMSRMDFSMPWRPLKRNLEKAKAANVVVKSQHGGNGENQRVFSHVKKGKIGFVTNWRKLSKPQLLGMSC